MLNAKAARNDEFYTQLSDIEKELQYYEKHFYDKTVYLNCDNPSFSNFWKYFNLNFNHLGIKKLIATYYDNNNKVYRFELTKANDDGTPIELKTIGLKQNGDFRSSESIEILQKADIIVTNPPFSLFREYIKQLTDYGKTFLIVGNKNAVIYKEMFPLMMNNQVWLGVTRLTEFILPSGELSTNMNGLTRWFTNLEHDKRNEELILYKTYNNTDYPTFDNSDIINVDKVKDIPSDYNNVIGVPITFFDKWNPNQFEIVGITQGEQSVNGKTRYARILIKKIGGGDE